MTKYINYVGDIFRTAILKLHCGSKAKINGIQHIRKCCWFDIDSGEIQIGKRVIFNGYNSMSTKGGEITIGDNVYFGKFCNIACHESVNIGDGCRFGPNVQIFDHNHKFTYDGITPEYSVGRVLIGDGTWIGANVTILKDTVIGEKCVIGAGAVVSGTIPARSIVKAERQLEIIPIRRKC